MGTRARKFVKFALSFSGSKRRERLGVDVNYWEEESCGLLEMVWLLKISPSFGGDFFLFIFIQIL